MPLKVPGCEISSITTRTEFRCQPWQLASTINIDVLQRFVLPDPFLLVIKAMVCFSASQNCKLVPYNFRPSHFDDTSEEGESEGELDSEEVELEESEEEGVGIDHGCES
jgi:hypothetical protein